MGEMEALEIARQYFNAWNRRDADAMKAFFGTELAAGGFTSVWVPDRINARWVERSGKHPSFFFSVTDDSGDVYQLQLQSAEMVWWLDSVALEG